jgi:hypothetical protein
MLDGDGSGEYHDTHHVMDAPPADNVSPFYEMQDIFQPDDGVNPSGENNNNFQWASMPASIRPHIAKADAKDRWNDEPWALRDLSSAIRGAFSKSENTEKSTRDRLEDVIHSIDSHVGIDRTHPEIAKAIQDHYIKMAQNWQDESYADLDAWTEKRRKESYFTSRNLPRKEFYLPVGPREDGSYRTQTDPTNDWDNFELQHQIAVQADFIEGFGKALTDPKNAHLSAKDVLVAYARAHGKFPLRDRQENLLSQRWLDTPSHLNTHVRVHQNDTGNDIGFDAKMDLARQTHAMPTPEEVLYASVGRRQGWYSSHGPADLGSSWTLPVIRHLESQPDQESFVKSFMDASRPYVQTGGITKYEKNVLEPRPNSNWPKWQNAIDNRGNADAIEKRNDDLHGLASAWWDARDAGKKLKLTPDEIKASRQWADMHHGNYHTQIVPVERRGFWKIRDGRMSEGMAIDRPVRKFARFLAMAAIEHAIASGAQTISFPTAWFQNGSFVDRSKSSKVNEFFNRHYKEVADAARQWIQDHGGEVRDIPFATKSSVDKSAKHSVTVPWAVITPAMREAMREHGINTFGANTRRTLESLSKAVSLRKMALLMKGMDAGSRLVKAGEPGGNMPPAKTTAPAVSTTGRLSTAPGSGFRMPHMSEPFNEQFLPHGSRAQALSTGNPNMTPMDARYGSLRVLEATRRRDAKQGANPLYSAQQLRQSMLSRNVPAEEIHWAGLGEGFAPEGKKTIDDWHTHASAHLPRFYVEDDHASANRYFDPHSMGSKGKYNEYYPFHRLDDQRPFMRHAHSYLAADDNHVINQPLNERINQRLEDEGFYHLDDKSPVNVGHWRGFDSTAKEFLDNFSPGTEMPHGVNPRDKHVHIEEIQHDYLQHPKAYRAPMSNSDFQSNVDTVVKDIIPVMDAQNEKHRAFTQALAKLGTPLSQVTEKDDADPHLVDWPYTSYHGDTYSALQDMIDDVNDESYYPHGTRHDPMAERFERAVQNVDKRDYLFGHLGQAIRASTNHGNHRDADLEEVFHRFDRQGGLDRTHPTVASVIRSHYDDLANRWYQESVADSPENAEGIAKEADRIRDFGKRLTDPENAKMSSFDVLKSMIGQPRLAKKGIERIYSPTSMMAYHMRNQREMPSVEEVLSTSQSRPTGRTGDPDVFVGSENRGHNWTKDLAKSLSRYAGSAGRDDFSKLFTEVLRPYVETGGHITDDMKQLNRQRSFDPAAFDSEVEKRMQPWAKDARHGDLRDLAKAWWDSKEATKYEFPDEHRKLGEELEAAHNIGQTTVPVEPVENRSKWQIDTDENGEMAETNSAFDRPVRKYARFLSMAAIADAINRGAKTISFPTAAVQNGEFVDRSTPDPKNKFFVRHYKDTADALRAFAKAHGGEVKDIVLDAKRGVLEKDRGVTLPYMVVTDAMRDAVREHGVDAFGPGLPAQLRELSKALPVRRLIFIAKGLK